MTATTTDTTFTRRAPRVRLPHLHLSLPHRREQSFDAALVELGAIDPRMAHELVAIARHQGL